MNVRSESQDRHILDYSEQPVLLDVIRLIEASPQVSQRTVAVSLGVSLGKANYCIRELIKKGLVKAENYRHSSNKLGYLYVLTPDGITAKAELARYFLERKMAEYEVLSLEIEQLKHESVGKPRAP